MPYATCSINFAREIPVMEGRAPADRDLASQKLPLQIRRMPQIKIREMPQDERPREKLLARGADALSDAELIAILLRTGRRGMNVVEVARELLDEYESFAELSRCSVEELAKSKESVRRRHWNWWRLLVWENASRRNRYPSKNSTHRN